MLSYDQLIVNNTIYESLATTINKLVFSRTLAYTHNQGTYFDYGAKLKKNIKSSLRALINNTYQFDPSKHKIKRIKSKVRDLYISTWKDRIIERWLSDELNNYMSKYFSQSSYAFRTDGNSIDICQARLAKNIRNYKYAAKLDISNFFYSINQQKMVTMLTKYCDDKLIKLLEQRIKFQYYDREGETQQSTVGLPFGSAISCVLANIYMTDIDHQMTQLNIKYYRYSDDILILANDLDTLNDAVNKFTKLVNDIDLSINTKKTSIVELTKPIKYLGLNFNGDGRVSLAVEKQRKIINLFKRALKYLPKKGDRLVRAVQLCNEALSSKFRNFAIVDYYLKHITYEPQLKYIDTVISELIISKVLCKKFRRSDYKKISFKQLRELGLVSLRHRWRLHRQGKLRVDIMQYRNDLMERRFLDMHNSRINKINSLRMTMTIRRNNRISE